MTNEEKQLLLKDLCARLPYGVVCVTTSVYYDNDDNEIGQMQGRLVSINKHGASFVDDRDDTTFGADFEDNGRIGFKPYLRPMSSMTEEEKEEHEMFFHSYSTSLDERKSVERIDWLNANHFDYRGLITMGLALEASEGMYVTTAQKKEEIEIPKNLEEALSILNEMVSDEDKEYLKENGAISAHLSLGMWIRNNFGLWENSEFYSYLFEKGFTHPDDMSNYVIEEFIKTL